MSDDQFPSAIKQSVQQALGRQQLDEAVRLLQEWMQLEPDNAEPWFVMGQVHLHQGDLAAAAKAFGNVTEALPEFLPAWEKLVEIHQRQNHVQAVRSCLEHMLSVDANRAEWWFRLAEIYRQLNELDAALQAYARLAELRPDFYQALNNYGALLKSTGRLPEASRILQQALQASPDSPEIMVNLAEVCLALGGDVEAMDWYRKALAVRPDFRDALLGLGGVLSATGNMDQALAQYDRLLQLNADDARARAGKAGALAMHGDPEAAWQILQPLVAQQHPLAGSCYLEIASKIDQVDEARQWAQNLLAGPALEPAVRQAILFRLGRLNDREGQFAQAFENYEQANALAAKDADLSASVQLVENIVATATQAMLAELPDSGLDSSLPVFIIGMPRSGTSLLEQILGVHSQVHAAGELNVIPQAVQRLEKQTGQGAWPGFFSQLTGAQLAKSAAGILQQLTRLDASATRITDKMPQNFLYAGLIARLFPRARIIHMRRHPMDTCLSCYFADFQGASHNYSYDLSSLGEYYGLYARLMQHWEAVLPGRMLSVSYEDLVDRPEPVLQQLLSDLGLDWEPACLDFHQSSRFVSTLSYEQVRQPLHGRSVGRWRNYAAWLEPLQQALESGGIDVGD